MPFQNRHLRIYSAPVLAQVTQMKHLLEMRGIECRIQGEHRAGLGAQIGPAEAWPELWLVDPARGGAHAVVLGNVRYCDGHGLYLDVRPTGSRSWVQRLAIRGRRRELGLGGFPLVSLKEARDVAFANRKLARSGGDPLAEKRRASGMPTFAEATERVWTDMRPGWRNPRHAHNWKSSLTRFAFPHIGNMPVCDVTSADIVDTLRRIWHEHPTTARRVRHRIRAVLEWAVAMELRNDNPCDRIGPALGPQNDIVTHRLALPHRDVAAAVETVRVSNAAPVVKLARSFGADRV